MKKERTALNRVEFVEFYNWTKTLENPNKKSLDFYRQRLKSTTGKEFVDVTVKNIIKDCGIELEGSSPPRSLLIQRIEDLEIIVKNLQVQVNRLEANI